MGNQKASADKGKGWQTRCTPCCGLEMVLRISQKCCFLLNYRKYRTNLTPTDRQTAQRSTTTRHGLPTKDEASAGGTGSWMHHWKITWGKSSLRQAVKREQQVPAWHGTRHTCRHPLSSSMTSWGCALLLCGHEECQDLQWGMVSVTPLLWDPDPTQAPREVMGPQRPKGCPSGAEQ